MDKINGAGHVGRQFVTEDAGTNRPPTEITADWLNAVQGELVAVIEGAGLALSSLDNTQLLQALEAMFAPIGALSGFAQLAVVQNWTKAQRGAISALADGVTIAPNFSLANNFSVTLGGNRTLATPSNLAPGQSGVITIKQDATGSRTLAFGSAWKFAGGTVPSLTTTPSAVDQLAYYVNADGLTIFAAMNKDVK